MSGAQAWLFARRWLGLLLLSTLLTGGAAYVVSVRLPKAYEASSTVLVAAGDSGPDAAIAVAGLPPDRIVATYAELLKSRTVVEAALSAAGVQLSYADALPLLTVAPRPGAQLIQVTVRSATPVDSARLANEVVQAAIEQTGAGQVARLQERRSRLVALADQGATEVADRTRQVDNLRAQPQSPARDTDLQYAQALLSRAQQSNAAITRSIDTVDLAIARAGDALSLLEPAVPPSSPVLPRVPVDVTLGSLVGLLVGLGAAVLGEWQDDQLLPPARAAQRTGLRVLGVVHKSPFTQQQRTALDLASVSVSEDFQELRAELQRNIMDNAPTSLLVTSGQANEGKTTIAAGVAVALARAGERVVLVDANLHRPGLDQLLGVTAQTGLTSVLIKEFPHAADALTPTDIAGLQLLAAGPSHLHAVDLLASRRMSQCLAELCAIADVVLVDSPPLTLSDPISLSALVDGIVLVVDARRTHGRDARASLARLTRSGATVVGMVLNRAPAERRERRALRTLPDPRVQLLRAPKNAQRSESPSERVVSTIAE